LAFRRYCVDFSVPIALFNWRTVPAPVLIYG
jgi:hypothetical protein